MRLAGCPTHRRLIVLLAIFFLPPSATDCIVDEPAPRSSSIALIADFLDSDSATCVGDLDCCPSEEQQIRVTAITAENFVQTIQDAVIRVRNVYHTYFLEFRELFYKNLAAAYEDLDALYIETYGPFYTENAKVLQTYFKRLRAFSSSYSVANIHRITEEFFEELFRVMFILSNPLEKELVQQKMTEGQWKCVVGNAKNTSAFGDMPERIGQLLTPPFLNWRSLVSAIETVDQILDGYLNLTLRDECIRGLARLEMCAHCSEVKEKPCKSFCKNVVSGCAHPFVESATPWRNVIEQLIKLARQIKDRYNLVNALQPLPVLISEAIMNFQERKDVITNEMISKCIIPEKLSRPRRSYTTNQQLMRVSLSRRARNAQELGLKLQHFIQKMISHKDLFTSLPALVCDSEDWALQADQSCWNGTAVGGYRNPAAVPNLPLTNPEYQGRDTISLQGVYVEERMKLHWLSSRIQNELRFNHIKNFRPTDDEDVLSDDEDYTDGSGYEVPLPSPQKDKNFWRLPTVEQVQVSSLVRNPTITAIHLLLFWFLSLITLI